MAVGGPVALSEVWIGNRVIAHDVQGDDLADVLQQNGDASAWSVASRTETEELRGLAKILGLDRLALAELLAPDHRCRVFDAGGNRLVRMLAVQLDNLELVIDSVSMIIADQVVIILADDRCGNRIARRLDEAGPRLTRGGADRAAQLVVEFLVETAADTVEQLESRSDELAERLFSGQPLSRDGKLDAFRLRRAVTRLRRVTEPTRDVLQELLDTAGDADGLPARHWNKINDHAERVATTVAMLGDSLTAIFDTSLSLDNARMDEVMKKLTGWAAIVAAPTLVTGFVGMNVNFWLAGSDVGFYIYLVLMLAAVLVLYLVFRRKSWI